MARPQRTWSDSERQQFPKLCALFCTRQEVASFYGMDVRTLDRIISEEYPDTPTWNEAYERFSAAGKASLRRRQFEVAMEGDKAMLIFLGKNYLGQSDNGLRQEERPVQASRLTAMINNSKFSRAANE